MNMVFGTKSDLVTEYPGSHSWELLAPGATACRGYRAMYNEFYNREYLLPYGVHDDNEGFYVVSGAGKMIIGDQESDLVPGMTMLAPANVPHAIKKTSDEDLGIFLFHFPVSD